MSASECFMSPFLTLEHMGSKFEPKILAIIIAKSLMVLLFPVPTLITLELI